MAHVHPTHINLIVGIVNGLILSKSLGINFTSNDGCMTQRRINLVQTLLIVAIFRNGVMIEVSSTWIWAPHLIYVDRELIIHSVRSGYLLRNTNLVHLWQMNRIKMLMVVL